MKSKSRKSLKLATIIGASLLLTAGVAATLSSCVVTLTGLPPLSNNGDVSQLNKKNEIDWKAVKRGEQKLIIDNGLVFKDNKKTELIAVVPEGALSSSQSLKSNHVVIPSSVTKISYYTEVSRDANGNRVKTIRGAFENNNYITNVNLGRVKTIEGPIFKNATKLTTVNLGSNLTEIPNSAFEGTTRLNNVIGSERIVKIGDLAFKNSFSTPLDNGKKIPLTLKDVTHIGTSAFEHTTQLGTVEFNENSLPLFLSPSTFKSSGITTINLLSRQLNDSSLPHNETNQPNNSLPASTFEDASSLATFTLPTSITTIGANAFKGTGLTNLDLSEYISLTSIRENAFANTSSLKNITLPNSIDELEAGFLTGSNVSTVNLSNTGITDIQAGALSGLSKLRIVNLPNSIARIRDSAFANNPELSSIINLNSESLSEIGANAFEGCAKLRNVTFGAGLTTLGESFLNGTNVTRVDLTASTNMESLSPRAFLNNTTVTNVQMPNSLTSIGESAFEGASRLASFNFRALTNLASINARAFKGTNLASINFPTNLTSIGDSAFEGIARFAQINLSGLNGLTTIGASAFKDLRNVTTLQLPNSLVTIGDSAFENLGSTASGRDSIVNLQASLSSIGASAFKGAKVNANFNAASGLTSIGNSAFENTRTTDVNLSAASELTTIGESAFKGTESSKTINNIQLPTSVTSIGNEAFRYTKAATVNLATLDQLTTIGAGAFADNAILNNLQLPMNNTNLDIQDGAFYKTTKLTRVNLPNNLTEIKPHVFAESGLTQLNLTDKNINTIGNKAFYKSKLTSLDLSANTTVTTIGPSAFSEITTLANVKLPNTLETLGDRAFAKSNSNNFNTIDLSNTQLATLSNETFKETNIATVTLPKTLTSIGENVFLNAAGNASSVTNVTWEPTTAITLPDNFYDQGNFGSVTDLTLKGDKISTLPSTNVPGGIETVDLSQATKLYALPASAFENTFLQEITLPGNLRTIGQNAFKATRLAKLDLSTTNVTSIPDGLLESNTKLTKVKLNPSTSSIGTNAFKGATKLENLNDNTTRSARVIEGLDLSMYNRLGSIGAEAFSGTKFTKIEQNKLPTSVRSIGAGAFSGMDALTTADISNLNTLTSIPERLFNGDGSLATVTLPTGITSIGNEAFKDTGLTDFTKIKKLTELTTIGNSAFEGIHAQDIDLTGLNKLGFIGSKVFANISGLQSLDLSGTKITHLPAEFLANSGGQNAGGGGSPYLGRYKQARPAGNNFTLTLPTTITTIDTNAFKDFKGDTIDLGQIKIDNVEFTPNLEGNTNLTSLSMPHGVTVINTNIVDQATKLTTLTLPGTAVNWNQSSTSETEPNAVTALSTVEFNVAALEDGTKATGFDSINWEQVANIVSMFTKRGSIQWNGQWNKGDIDPDLIKVAWSDKITNTDLDLSDSVSTSVTKIMNDLNWTYTKSSSTPPVPPTPGPSPYANNKPYATLEVTGQVFFKATNGKAYSFGKDGSSSKQITIKINLYTK